MLQDSLKLKIGPDRESNPEPRAPEARIIPLDHQAYIVCRYSDIFFKIVLSLNMPFSIVDRKRIFFTQIISVVYLN
jgi:hypothetical protein